MTPSYDGLDIIQILVMMDSMLVQTENVVISVVKLLSVDLTSLQFVKVVSFNFHGASADKSYYEHYENIKEVV